MKYLKKFEGVDILSKEISEGEYNKAIYNVDDLDEEDIDIEFIKRNRESFTDKEIKELQTFFIEEISPSGDDFEKEKYIMREILISDIVITKMRDEWYYVCISDTDFYYRCDTFEGLIRLFKNNEILKKLIKDINEFHDPIDL